MKKLCKVQSTRKFLFQIFWLSVMRPKRGWNIFESLKSWQMTEPTKDKQSWIFFFFSFWWTNQVLICSKQSKLNFWNQLHLQFLFSCCLWHKYPPDNQTSNFDIQCHINAESYDWHNFLDQVSGWSKILIYTGFFFSTRKSIYFGADWLDLLLYYIYNKGFILARFWHRKTAH